MNVEAGFRVGSAIKIGCFRLRGSKGKGIRCLVIVNLTFPG